MKNILKEFALYLLIATVLFNVTVNVLHQKYVGEMEQDLLEADILLAESMEKVNSTLGGLIELLESHQGLILKHSRLILRHDINLAILKQITKPQVEPDFEKLLNGTVVIYNKGYIVGGVCIAEDETYYYILTCQHILGNREDRTSDNDNAIPESSMGLATNLQSIVLFLTDVSISESIFQKEIMTITVQTNGYTLVAGQFLYANDLLDLGLLKVYKSSGIRLEVIKIAETFPKLGDDVYVLGHPLGRRYNLSKGIVSNLDRPYFMGIDALMTWGNSGGAVFNTEGKIIGTCSRVPAYIVGELENEI